MKLTAKATPLITGKVHCASIRYFDSPLLHGLTLSDVAPKKLEKVEVDVLIGSDYYFDIVMSEHIAQVPNLFLIGFHLSWIVSGYVTQEKID